MENITIAESGEGKSHIKDFWELVAEEILLEFKKEYPKTYKNLIVKKGITEWVEEYSIFIKDWDKLGNMQKGGVEFIVKSKV